MTDLTGRMREDWDRRAREDARYYVAFGQRRQQEAEFEATAADVVRSLDRELLRFGPPGAAAKLRALEIGCGPGRLLGPMSRRFAEVHGVDVSEEMIRLARERLAAAPNVFVRTNSGSDLASYAGDSFDFVYSYAVFQHIPSREVVFNYLSEARRVLRPGGILRCQINGLPGGDSGYDTWNGVRIDAREILEFARREDMQLLALEGRRTQYMWVTLAKRPRGWHDRLVRELPEPRLSVRRVTNAYSSEPLAPARGRFASVALWLENVPDTLDLLHLEAKTGGLEATPFYLGPAASGDGLWQLNLSLPEGLPTGLVPLNLLWLGRPAAPEAVLRIVPPGPVVPRIISVSDAVDLLSGLRIRSGAVKVVVEEVEKIECFRAAVDGREIEGIETFCVDPVPMRWEINLPLGRLEAGRHLLQLRLERRKFPPIEIEIEPGP